MRISIKSLCLPLGAILLLRAAPAVFGDEPAKPADSLSRVLEHAKSRGMLIDKPAPKERVPTTTMQKLMEPAKNTLEPSCSAAQALDFSDLNTLSSFDEIYQLEGSKGEDLSEGQSLYLGRLYLALGLGVEVKALLRGNTTEEAALLVRAADLVEHTTAIISSANFSDYSDCSAAARLWALFEPRDAAAGESGGLELREHIDTLSAFPPHLADRLIVNVAIENAQRGDMRVTKAFWTLMENRAIEYGHKSPQDRHEDDDYLYLWALLNVQTDTARAAGIFEYISEKESVFRAPALQNLVKMGSANGISLASNVKANLIEVSQMTDDTQQSEAAAFVLVEYHVSDGEFISAIDLVKERITTTPQTYFNALNKIGAGISDAVNSTTASQQISGLNSYFYDPVFFDDFDEIDTLKLDVVKASLAAGLPSLANAVYTDESEQTAEVERLLNRAQILARLSYGELKVAARLAMETSASDDLLATVASHAMMESDFGVARQMASAMMDGPQKVQMLDDILWLDAKWSLLSNSSTDDAPSGAQQILAVLSSQLLTPPPLLKASSSAASLSEALPNYFIQLDEIVSSAQGYLDNG